MNLRVSVALLLMVSVLVAFASPQLYAYGSWTLPYGVLRIHANSLWDNNGSKVVDPRANAGQMVRIAIIDSGIDYYVDDGGNVHYHPDLANNTLNGKGFSYYSGFVHQLKDYKDGDGHGTHVAGTIAAVGNDGGVVGVALRTRIYALKLFTFNPIEVATAINYSVDTLRANIISMSFAGPYNYPVVRTACDYAYSCGALLIAATGNENASAIDYPARYNESVVAVGAVDQNDQRWVDPSTGEGSNFGPQLELMAPGVNINSTWLNGGYNLDTGTSMAVPHVTAVAALIWSSKVDPAFDYNQDGVWENNEVRAKLRQYALDLGAPGRDDHYGYGLVNAWEPNQRPLGDINVDHKVNLKDYFAVALAFGSSPGAPNWDQRADINIDNKVNLIDYYIVVDNFGKVDP